MRAPRRRDPCSSDTVPAEVPGAPGMAASQEGLWGDGDEEPVPAEPRGCSGPAGAQPQPDPLAQTGLLRDLEMGPLAHTQTLRDFEQHLNDLKKENFSLKLRIYFLEERVQQKGEDSRDDVYRRNIELKVEVESLKRELQEKQQALDNTWVAAESQTSRSQAALRQQYEERQRESEHVYELLENKIQLLQEVSLRGWWGTGRRQGCCLGAHPAAMQEARLARSEAEQATALARAEAERCRELTGKLKEAARTKQEDSSDNGCGSMAQRRIEELTQELAASNQLVEMLSAEKRDLQQCLEGSPVMEGQNLQHGGQQAAPGSAAEGEHVADVRAAELQGKLQHSEAANKLLQEKLNELNFELKSVQETTQRQDRTIQSLNEALKSKESKTEELYHIIEGQNETMAKLRDMLHRNHLGQQQVSESPLSPQEQQMSPLDLQNALFCTKLEVQKLQRAQRQKEHQLAEAKRATQLLETTVHEEEQQKEATWKHNQELRAVVQQLQAELQDKAQQLQTLEWEKSRELQAQEQRVQRLTQQLAHKEQLLQESRELLQCQQSLEKSPAAMNAMLEKLQQRVSDRDAALERAVDEKFCALEKKEQELQQLRVSMRERGSDLDRLRSVLCSNEATIHSLESLLKAKTLELEQVSATCQNLRWLKEEIEAKSGSRQKEQEGIIQQLQTCLHDRNKEVEELTATLLCKLGPGQSEVAEELCLRLQHKEKMLQDLLSDRNRQTVEHDAEIRELLQALSTKEQQSRVAAEKMAQALAERSSELQLLRQHVLGKDPVGTQSAGARPLKQDKQPIQEILQRAYGATVIAGSPQEDSSCRTEGVTMSAAELEKDLVNAKEELELMAKKERESRRELSALQAVLATQEEELQVQASDIESLTRTIQMKEDLIKDLQMQLVDPEEIPAMERLTQEVLVLREKVAVAESQGQEAAGNRRQQLLLMLEGLVAERNRLNEALQAERQLYGSLVKFHTHPDSAARDHALQVELEGVHELRGRLEEALGRSLECLSRLETQGAIGGQAAGSRTDGSTNFTDSMKEEAARGLAPQQSNPRARKENGGTERSTAPTVPERELRAEQELRELKAQLEEAGFSSVSHIRKAMLSLCLENAELKERMGEATSLLESGEQEEPGLGSALAPEPRRLPRRSRGALGDRPGGGSGDGPGLPAERGAVPTKRPALETRAQGDMAKRPCPGSPGGGDGSHAEGSVPAGGWPGLGAELRSQVAQEQRQCQELQDKLAASEATVRAQAEQLEKYHVLLREPQAQQLSKQVQVDFQDLGYETCGRSETEADRDETTSPECEEPDVFSETSLGEELGSPCQPGMSRVGKTAQKTMALEDVEALHQHIQDLKAQLLNANKVIQSLQRRARSISVTSGYTSSAERPLAAPKALASPAHSLTDEDEGWQSDGHGALCPPALRAHRDLQSLVHRVTLLEAQLPAAKHGAALPKELHSATWPGKYNSLIQAQARELSHLRQVLREGRGQSRGLAQHLRDALRSFEDLLRGTDIDYYLGQGFREQLAQGRHLAERLSDKLGIRDRQDGEDKTSHELLAQRLSQELQKEKVIESLEVKLQERSESPGSSCPPSESSHSASSSSFTSEGLEPCSDGDAASEYSQCHEEPAQHTGVTLPMAPAKPSVPLGPFGEGSKAPASFCRHGALQGPAELPRGLWDVPPAGQLLYGALAPGYPCGQKLTGADLLEEHLVEIRNLRQRLEESICTNDRLREQLERRLAGKGSGLPSDAYGQTPELGLQLSRENQALHEENRTLRLQRDHLSQELARVQETLVAACSRAREAEAELGQRRGKQRRLAEELSECQESVRQLRDERRSLQEDNNRLQHSVTLLQQQSEEQRLLLQTLRAELHVYESLPGPSAETRAGCFPSPPVRDVGTNSAAPLLSPLPSGTSVLRRMDEPRGADVLLRKSEGLTGAHVVGRLDTYRALEQHMVQGKALARELMCLTRPALGLPNCPLPAKEGWTGTGQGHLWGSASTLHGILEECVSLLAAFWSTVLPVSAAQHQGKVSRGWGPAGHRGRCSELIPRPCPRSRCSRVRSRRCGPGSPRGRMLCRARPGGCAAQPSSRTAWSSSSSASVRAGVAQPSLPAPHVPHVVLWHRDLTDPISLSCSDQDPQRAAQGQDKPGGEFALMPWGWTQMAHTPGGCPGVLRASWVKCVGNTFLSVLSQHVHVPRAQQCSSSLPCVVSCQVKAQQALPVA
uniref:Phosphodiesterase 4D interacting protein n=1 Tax=Junco hyemalis TaxID=40217 RepID=A0A8C5IJ03_JUNHY